MNNIEVSLVIPNYNNARFLRKCVESAVYQSYKFSKIIIVDDCSNDNSVELIKQLQTAYDNVVGIFLKHNGGVSNARNIGLKAVETEYVTFMDADDYYYNVNKVLNEVNLISYYLEKGKDILSYSITVNADNSGIVDKNKMSYRFNPKFLFINGNAYFQLLSYAKQKKIPRDYIIKKSILEKVEAYSFYKNFYEDLDLLMRISKSGIPFYCTFEYGTCYRESIQGLSKRTNEEHIQTKKEIRNMYYSELSFPGKIVVKMWEVFGATMSGLIYIRKCIKTLLK